MNSPSQGVKLHLRPSQRDPHGETPQRDPEERAPWKDPMETLTDSPRLPYQEHSRTGKGGSSFIARGNVCPMLSAAFSASDGEGREPNSAPWKSGLNSFEVTWVGACSISGRGGNEHLLQGVGGGHRGSIEHREWRQSRGDPAAELSLTTASSIRKLELVPDKVHGFVMVLYFISSPNA